ncbi:MAG: GyrI-like domain-containing protein [Planctomycetota bacterium]|jgi:effector-binding domain-containing protein
MCGKGDPERAAGAAIVPSAIGRAILLLVLALLAACNGGEERPDPLARAIEALGGRAAFASVESLAFRVEGTLATGQGERKREAETLSEHFLRLPDGLASRRTTDGLLRRSAVTDEGVWIRMGAAVMDAKGERAAEARLSRDDLLCLLLLPLADERVLGEREVAYDPETGLPTRIAREGLRLDITMWRRSADLLFPARFVRVDTRGGPFEETLAAQIRNVVVNPTDPTLATFSRPDDGGPAKLGEIRRKRMRATSTVTVTHRGPLIDLGRVDHFIERALERSLAHRRAPNARIFESFPDEEGLATIKTFVPVSFSRDPKAENLPPGAVSAHHPAEEVLYAVAVGPYPTDGSLHEPLLSRAAELGLEPAGPPRHYILSRPDEGEPNELRQEIHLPVRERR